MGMIRSVDFAKEGDFLYKFHDARFKSNRNPLGVVLGPTGSAKSYTALRILEIEYKRRFNKPFPIENVTFSIGQTMKRIKEIEKSGVKGELLMPDDVGAAGYGALEFQQKSSKMFSYTLQSFRSLNIGLIMTLPVLTMLNKQGRQLIHYQLITQGIDYENKISKVKPLFHQLNQSSGKSYWKYPRIAMKGKVRTLKRLNYSIPSQELRDKYEEKKKKFLSDLTAGFIKELDADEMKRNGKQIRYPTELEYECYHLWDKDGLTQEEIAKRIGKSPESVFNYIKRVKDYQKLKKIRGNDKENP